MIIEILQKEDVLRVEDELLRKYLEYSLKRLPEGFDYYNHVREYGYFCVATEAKDLMANGVILQYWILPSISDETFWERVELIEMQENGVGDEVIEILVNVDTDIAVSLIFRKSIVDDVQNARIMKFIYEK
jgi:hypothetical protein